MQKTSANAAMTDGNACYSLKRGQICVCIRFRAEAEAGRKPVTIFITDETGYGESEEVLEVGKEYFIRETEPPANGSFLADPAINTVKARERRRSQKTRP